MHHVNADKTHRELHKNDTSYTEQILEATPHETTFVRPLTSHLKIYPCGTQPKKQERTHKLRSAMEPFI